MPYLIQNCQEIAIAHQRILPHIHQTALWQSHSLNQMLGCNIFLKMDALQKTGAFKIRGVLNHLLYLQELDKLPKQVVAYSTGNHALALAYAAQFFKIKARIYLPENVSSLKKKIAADYGAELIETKTRQEAENGAKLDGGQEFHYLPPSDDEKIIAGAGTMCYEALEQLGQEKIIPEAIFAPCGGGGLLAGSYLATELIKSKTSAGSAKKIKLYGAEPQKANDAYRSLKDKKIFRFADSPTTIADGLRTLSISPYIYHYLEQIEAIELVTEEAIIYWTMWLAQLTKIICEPSAAIAMAAAFNWLQRNKASNILVLITGGNVDLDFYKELTNSRLHLQKPPNIF